MRHDKWITNGFMLGCLIGLVLLCLGRRRRQRYPGYCGPIPPRLPGGTPPPFA